MYHSYAVSGGDHDRAIEEARILYPMRSSHFAVAIQAESAGENGISGFFTSRQNGGYASSHRPDANL